MALILPDPPGDGPLAVAFSGGLDSTVLLHRLAADPALRARGLRALHVDHGLQPASAGWAVHCAAVCAQQGVPFDSVRVEVADAGEGLEAAARAARYAAFAAWQREGELLALAHHRDDQAETVLLRLLRGAGGDGLAAMRAYRPFGRGGLWRPLLDIARDELHHYAQAHGLRWIEDPSNASDAHDRNYLRRRVIPVLAARWPQAGGNLARSAALLGTQADLLSGEDRRRLAPMQGLDPATLAIAALAAEPAGWRDRLLRAWIADLGLPPMPGAGLATIQAELLPARGDAEATYRWPGAAIRAWRGRLYADRDPPPLADDWEVRWPGTEPLPLPTGDSLRVEPGRAFDAPLAVRARRGGERLRLPGRNHRSELKHVLQDLGIPPWQRRRLPLLFAADGELLAAGDVAVSARLHAWLAEHAGRLRLIAGH